jgi:hypothetical protein
LLSDLLEVAAREHKDFDEPLMLGWQIRQPRRWERGIDRNAAGMAGHATDRH